MCELPNNNPSDTEIKKILEEAKTIAIVGLSKDPEKTSYRVAQYLKINGYKIIPVNPSGGEILGEKCYTSLKEIPEIVDIVNIFRKPEALAEVVDEAIEIKPKVIWMQLGLANNKAAEKACEHGIKVIMNKCIKIEHSVYL